MPYVERDSEGSIVGVYANPQAGLTTEFLADDAAEVVAFRTPTPKTIFTPLEFIERFTTDEQAAISTAALANADLNLWLAKAMGAQEIDPTDARTVAGMDALVAAGLITEQRKTEILTP